ncbi:ATP-binding cassette, subfamily B, MsbA [Algoriphagus aquaeductus]|uniref:Multidrug resistance-like ATP-binding protein MdlB n=1 Tax=Algoriphagus aquaeductus TaxID=475299 RepID=A0A326RQ13_9BACT|nr:ABC transporter ATP-binding protein/permease [Algoriphagus aquaeductus]PZV79124.1 ATP-binding cassette, subfamily B, MsbA [Algoriphagus aquaeductus]
MNVSKNIVQRYFRHFYFFYTYLGYRSFILIFLSILVGLLDGFGLAMFIPVFQLAADGGSINSFDSLGDLKIFFDWIQTLGFSVNLTLVIVIMILLFLLKAILKYVDGIYKIRLQNKFVKKLRNQLVDGLSSLDYKAFLGLDSGKIQNVLGAEGIKLTYGFLAYFNSVQHAVLLLVYVSLAMLSNLEFAILVSLGGLLSNFMFQYLFKSTEIASLGLSNLGHTYQSYLVQSVYNFKYLKATGYFYSYKLKIKDIIDKIEFNQRKIGKYNAIMSSAREPIILLVVVLIIVIQVHYLEGAIATIMLSLMFLYRALNYIVTLQGSWQGFIANIGGLRSSVDLIKEFNLGIERFPDTPLISKVNYILLENVSFSYPNGFQVLSNINLDISSLKTFAFIGESGSGKTSLVNLIVGLISPSSGKIYVNGLDRNYVNLASFRERIGYITQEPVIFNDTIYHNITLWASHNSDNFDKFKKAIRLANLDGFIESLPEKEHTRLGDNGILISGGQKQRISIARELFKDVDILIFDEATSALDSETEKQIQENIDMLMGKFTMILIAHRLSTIKKADSISVMASGKVMDTGTFDELYQRNLQFKKMIELQEF